MYMTPDLRASRETRVYDAMRALDARIKDAFEHEKLHCTFMSQERNAENAYVYDALKAKYSECGYSFFQNPNGTEEICW